MRRWLAVLAIGVAILVISLAWNLFGSEGENEVTADFTILLDEPIARDGGAVIVLPTPRAQQTNDVAEFKAELQTLGQIAVVRLFFPEGAKYVYRFRSIDDKRFPNSGMMSKRVGVGSRKYVDPESTAIEEVPTVLTHHIDVVGGKWSESQTRQAGAETHLGFLERQYTCETTEHALACDATSAERQK